MGCLRTRGYAKEGCRAKAKQFRGASCFASCCVEWTGKRDGPTTVAQSERSEQQDGQ